MTDSLKYNIGFVGELDLFRDERIRYAQSCIPRKD